MNEVESFERVAEARYYKRFDELYRYDLKMRVKLGQLLVKLFRLMWRHVKYHYFVCLICEFNSFSTDHLDYSGLLSRYIVCLRQDLLFLRILITVILLTRVVPIVCSIRGKLEEYHNKTIGYKIIFVSIFARREQ